MLLLLETLGRAEAMALFSPEFLTCTSTFVVKYTAHGSLSWTCPSGSEFGSFAEKWHFHLIQVTALIKLKECEDSHLGEEVDRNWHEVVTQQYLFDRLAREVVNITLFKQA